MGDKTCPPHNNGLALTDTTCHSHEGDLHQFGHNAHCLALNCPHALSGCAKHPDVPVFGPRDLIEKTVARFELLLPEQMKDRIISSGKPQKIITLFARVAHAITQRLPAKK